VSVVVSVTPERHGIGNRVNCRAEYSHPRAWQRRRRARIRRRRLRACRVMATVAVIGQSSVPAVRCLKEAPGGKPAAARSGDGAGGD
jgi:hypothetical protein